MTDGRVVSRWIDRRGFWSVVVRRSADFGGFGGRELYVGYEGMEGFITCGNMGLCIDPWCILTYRVDAMVINGRRLDVGRKWRSCSLQTGVSSLPILRISAHLNYTGHCHRSIELSLLSASITTRHQIESMVKRALPASL